MGSTAVLLSGRGPVPDPDAPVCTAGDEQPGVIVVPGDTVDRHVMSLVAVHKCTGICFGTDVDTTFFRADQEDVILLHVEVKRCPPTCNPTWVTP